MPKVSVIIPSFNHEKFIKECIESVLAQTFQDFEIVITDDGSTDHTIDVIKSFKDARIKLFVHSQNQGISAAENNCIARSHGKYIAALGSDDAWLPKKLEAQVKYLDEHPNIGAVFGKIEWVDKNGQLIKEADLPIFRIFDARNRNRYEWLRYFFFKGNCLCEPSSMVRRKCFDEVGMFDPSLANVPDFDLWVRLCFKYDIYILSQKLVRYRRVSEKANASGVNSLSINRTIYEYKHSMDHYLQIRDPQELLRVFPQAKRYGRITRDLIPYFIARLAIDTRIAYKALWGLDVIYAFIKDESAAHRLEKQCGFTRRDFIKLTGKNNVFNILQVQSLKTQVAEKDHSYKLLISQIAEKEKSVRALTAQIAEKDNSLRSLMAQVARRDRSVRALKAEVAEKDQKLDSLTHDLNEILISKIWKFALLIRRVRLLLIPPASRRSTLVRRVNRTYKVWRLEGTGATIRRIAAHLSRHDRATSHKTWLYESWIRNNEPNGNKLAAQRKSSTEFESRPLISVVTPVYKTPLKILIAAIESVIYQTYNNWELCIANGSPEIIDLRQTLDAYAGQDSRIKIIHLEDNRGIAGNTNAALALASGEWVGFLDHDDQLAPFALFEVAKAIGENPTLDLIYSDEDKVDKNGHRSNPFFKPAFSLDFLRSINYIPHFLVLRKSLGDQVAWFRNGYDGAQDYDLILRVVEKAQSIAHIPKVLYHWRASSSSTAGGVEAKPYANASGKKALQEHLDRMKLPGQVEDGFARTIYHVNYRLAKEPLISILIPTQDHATDLEKCVNSILQKTTYRNFEIVLIENGSKEQETFKLYTRLQMNPKVRLIKWDGPFNYSSVNNWGAAQARGEVLLFLNNDIQVINGDWLEQMLQFAMRPDIGAVGAKLFYPDGTIQHGGVVIGVGGIAGHSHRQFAENDPGYFASLVVVHDVSAVTAACLMLRKNVFEEVGGFDERYILAFGDVDLCVSILEKGYVNIWTPYAKLIHHESKTRGYEDNEEKLIRFNAETRRFRQKWSTLLDLGDQYYNPNLTLDNEQFGINPNRVKASVRITHRMMVMNHDRRL